MVSAKSPPIISSSLKSKSPKSPRSPRSPRSTSRPSESFTPLSSILTEEPTSTDNGLDDELKTPISITSPPAKGLALRRVLSGGSSSSIINTNTGTIPSTPTNGNGLSSTPLSPNSNGTRTPKAKKNPLVTNSNGGNDKMDIDIPTDSGISNNGNVKKEEGHQLANHLDGLQVNSPINIVAGNDPGFGAQSALGITQVLGHQTSPPHQPQPFQNQSNHAAASSSSASESGLNSNSNPYFKPINGRNSTHDRSYSTSTEGSTTSYHPNLPSNLGSSYGPEGFPVYSRSPEDSPNIFNSSQQSMNGNGYHASLNVGFGGSDSSGKNIDPELALKQAEALAKADEAVRALNGTASLYQSNNSSIPTFEPYNIPQRNQFASTSANFVTPQQPNVVRQSSTSSSTTDAASTSSEESDWCIPSIEWVSTNPQSPRFLSGYPNSPGGIASYNQRDRDRAASRMPPPSTTNRPTSPRNAESSVHRPTTLNHQQSLPIGASASTPSGTKQSSALPIGLPPDGLAEDDDDEATVGHNRERSPSTSSQSAQSGLDLLWRAAAVQSIPSNKPHLPVYENAASFDHKGKRKAGAEAVDKWRSSGIPTGVPPPPLTPTTASPIIPSTGEFKNPTTETHTHGHGHGHGQPPKKRRRSEMTLESMEPRDGSIKRDLSAEEAVVIEDEAEDAGDESEFKSPSVSSEPPSEEDDSEYGTGHNTHKRGRPSGRGGRAIAGTKRATASAKSGAGGKPAINPANAPGGVTKGGTIKKVRKVGDSPPGGNRGGRRSSGGPAGGAGTTVAGGVQCEYVNPLPPYNRCTDVFTRKYDLPRHMARHARREGELVLDGKLSEEKAVLWRTIKDKPKVTCNECGENFTRMDALKRHQAKQHH